MSEKLQTLKQGYESSLSQTLAEIKNLTLSLEQANIKKEQLRGAIFALETALVPEVKQEDPSALDKKTKKKE